MPRPQFPSPARRASATVALAVIALLAFSAVAVAKQSAEFHRGGLPSIGQITLNQQRSGGSSSASPSPTRRCSPPRDGAWRPRR